jgi:hypothetical protein
MVHNHSIDVAVCGLWSGTEPFSAGPQWTEGRARNGIFLPARVARVVAASRARACRLFERLLSCDYAAFVTQVGSGCHGTLCPAILGRRHENSRIVRTAISIRTSLRTCKSPLFSSVRKEKNEERTRFSPPSSCLSRRDATHTFWLNVIYRTLCTPARLLPFCYRSFGVRV